MSDARNWREQGGEFSLDRRRGTDNDRKMNEKSAEYRREAGSERLLVVSQLANFQ